MTDQLLTEDWTIIDAKDESTWPKMRERCLFYRAGYAFSHFYGRRTSETMVTMEIYTVRIAITELTAFKVEKLRGEEIKNAFLCRG